MFNTDLTAAIAAAKLVDTSASLVAGHEASVASFVNEAVSHLGLGVEAVADGVATFVANAANTTLATYSAAFTLNGVDSTLDFTATAVAFGDKNDDGDVADAGEKAEVVNEGTTVNGTPTATKKWKAVVTVDGVILCTLVKLVKA